MASILPWGAVYLDGALMLLTGSPARKGEKVQLILRCRSWVGLRVGNSCLRQCRAEAQIILENLSGVFQRRLLKTPATPLLPSVPNFLKISKYLILHLIPHTQIGHERLDQKYSIYSCCQRVKAERLALIGTSNSPPPQFQEWAASLKKQKVIKHWNVRILWGILGRRWLKQQQP